MRKTPGEVFDFVILRRKQMSVVVAIKKDGVVYMGADTQTTSGIQRRNYLKESNLKIATFDNGMIIGHVGAVSRKSILFHSKNIIPKLKIPKEGLTKKVICEQLIPMLRDQDVFFDKDEAEVDASMLIGYGDKLFRVRNESVTEINEYSCIGSGVDFAWAVMEIYHERLDPVSLLDKAMRASANKIPSVSGPFVFVNTKDRKIEVRE